MASQTHLPDIWAVEVRQKLLFSALQASGVMRHGVFWSRVIRGLSVSREGGLVASIFFAEVDPARSVWLGSRQLWWQLPDLWITAKTMCSYGQQLPSQLHDPSAS